MERENKFVKESVEDCVDGCVSDIKLYPHWCDTCKHTYMGYKALQLASDTIQKSLKFDFNDNRCSSINASLEEITKDLKKDKKKLAQYLKHLKYLKKQRMRQIYFIRNMTAIERQGPTSNKEYREKIRQAKKKKVEIDHDIYVSNQNVQKLKEIITILSKDYRKEAKNRMKRL